MAASNSIVPALQIGVALAGEFRKMGGKAKCLRTPDCIIVEQSGVSKGQIQPLIDGIDDVRLAVFIEERASPEFDLEAESILPGELSRARLTKKYLFGLPDGAIVVGNLVMDGVPNFMVQLNSGEDRTRIWRLAENAQAAQGICNVYWNRDDVLAVHGIDPDAWNDAYARGG
jgi:hypothetical protein